MLIKSASGFGDSIYIYPIAVYHINQGVEDITVMTNYPKLFQDLPVKTTPHTKEEWGDPIKKISYCGRKYKLNTTQWEDVKIAAEVPPDVDLEIPWKIKNQPLIDLIFKRSKGKPYCVVASPYKPFGRDDGFGSELTIDYTKYDEYISRLKEKYFIVELGKEEAIYKLKSVDMTLNRKTTEADVMDIVLSSSYGVFPVGHMLPIHEALNKRGAIFFSDKGLNSEQGFISSITPSKVIHKKHLFDVRVV